MSGIRALSIASFVLFAAILIAGVAKKREGNLQQVEEVPLSSPTVTSSTLSLPSFLESHSTGAAPETGSSCLETPAPTPTSSAPSTLGKEQEPSVDRIGLLFNPYGPHLPIVQTVRYSPRVSWLKERQPWIVDYASHHQTCKHFISRSLTGKRDYFHQEIKSGDRFNVLRSEPPFEFFLLVDTTLCKMRFFYLEPSKREMVLLKSYNVVLGRHDPMSPAGCITPLGRYRLGSRIAVYKPGMIGNFRKQKTEMIRVFGTRWIPFEEEIAGCSAPAKGYGIHGFAWLKGDEGQWKEDPASSTPYSSDGCIRMATEDMEELFAIIVTRPTTIEIVRHFEQSTQEARLVEPVVINQES